MSTPAWLGDLAQFTRTPHRRGPTQATIAAQLGHPARAIPWGDELLMFALNLCVTSLDHPPRFALESLRVRLVAARQMVDTWARARHARADAADAANAALDDWIAASTRLPRAAQSPMTRQRPLLALHFRLAGTPGYSYLVFACHRALRACCDRLWTGVREGRFTLTQAQDRAAGFVLPLEYLARFLHVRPDVVAGHASGGLPVAVGEIERAMQAASTDVGFSHDTREKYAAAAMAVLNETYRPRAPVPPEQRVVRPGTAPGARSRRRRASAPARAPRHEADGGPDLRLVPAEPATLAHDRAGVAVVDEFPLWLHRSTPPFGVLAPTLSALADKPLSFAAALTAVMTGWGQRTLRGLALTPDAQGTCRFEPGRGIFICRHAPADLAQGHTDLYEPGGDEVVLPVEGRLRKTLSRLAATRSRLAEPEDMPRILEEIRTAARARGVRCDLAAFARAFVPLAVSRYGLDPVEAAYVSGAFPRPVRVVAAYTNLGPACGTRYLAYQRGIYQELQQACGMMLPTWGPPRTDTIECRFGSQLVPRADILVTWSRDAEREIRRERDPGHALTRVMVKCAIDLTILTGLRPEEIGDLPLGGVDLEGALLLVRGEPTRYYIEHRAVVLIPAAATVVRDALRARTELIGWAARTQRRVALQDPGGPQAPLFMVCDAMQTVRPLSASVLRWAVRACFSTPFPFALNAPRHLVRSTLYRAGVPFEAANALLGHQVAGHEYFHRTGLGSVSALRRAVEPALRPLAALTGRACA